MLAPYTILLYAISGSISLFIFLWIEVFFKKRTHQVKITHYFALWFLFFFLYNLFLSSSLVLSFNGVFLSAAYNIAITLLFIGCIYVIKVPFAVFFIEQKLVAKITSLALVVLTILISVGQIFYPATPSLDASGKYIFWNPNSIVAILITAGLIGVALIFAFIFFVGAFYLKETILKMRSLLFALGAFALAVSAYYYYPVRAKTTSDIIISFIFGAGGMFVLALGLLIVRVLKRFSGEQSMQEKQNETSNF